MRILCISDTHGMHLALPREMPKADVIIHAGDFSNHGTMEDAIRFFAWFNAIDYKHRICIAGNHDVFMERGSQSAINAIIPPGVTYLKESGVTIDGIKFWGSPYQPEFFNWAFNVPRGKEIREHWDLIPADTDVLITHGPAKNILDHCPNFQLPGSIIHVGCEELRKVLDQIKPRAHIFGHVHYPGGEFRQTKDTLSLNVAICTEAYAPINKPQMFDIDQYGDARHIRIT